jgi:dipeptidase
MHISGGSVTAASLIAVLPTDLAAGAPLRAYVALGSPCVSIFVPAFVRTAAGPPPFVPRELSSESMWRAADALRQRVDADPAAIGEIREVLDPVEAELWFEAAEIVETPDRWADVAASWGGRALAALQSCAP